MTTFDYEQFNKKGLKDVVKYFDKKALPVKEVRGNNIPKRENGFQVKSAEIEFESGQVLLVKAKPQAPAFFQVKLNNKVLAIRDYKQLDNELREIAIYVQENEPKFSKNQEKAAAKQKIKIDLPPAVSTTVAEQTEALQAGLAELQGQSEALTNQVTEITAQVSLKSSMLADLQSKLDAEKAVTVELEAAIEKAKNGIFEAAGNSVNDLAAKLLKTTDMKDIETVIAFLVKSFRLAQPAADKIIGMLAGIKKTGGMVNESALESVVTIAQLQEIYQLVLEAAGNIRDFLKEKGFKKITDKPETWQISGQLSPTDNQIMSVKFKDDGSIFVANPATGTGRTEQDEATAIKTIGVFMGKFKKIFESVEEAAEEIPESCDHKKEAK